MQWPDALSTGGAKGDGLIATGGAAAGIFAAFSDMTIPALIIFGLTAVLIAGRAALTWVRFCKEWRSRRDN